MLIPTSRAVPVGQAALLCPGQATRGMLWATLMDFQADELQLLIRRWYDDGDKQARARLWEYLDRSLRVRPEVRRVLDEDAIHDARLTAIARLLDPAARRLAGATSPIHLTRQEFDFRLRDALRKAFRRQRCLPIVEAQPEELPANPPAVDPEDEPELVGGGPSASTVRRQLSEMPLNRRMALLLTTRPDLIDEAEWRELSRRSGIAARPTEPLDVAAASLLIWPPSTVESDEARGKRLGRCRRERSRAVGALRELWRNP